MRFDELSIRGGVRGVINTLRHLGMMRPIRSNKAKIEPLVANKSAWMRASESGIALFKAELDEVEDTIETFEEHLLRL